MSERAERVPRKPYVTSSSRREAWIGKIYDKYNRTPTANELLALDNLPCAPQSQLFDRSRPGVYVYQRLRYAEATGDVSLLEEAGRILRLQMANTWTPPATSINSNDNSMSSAWTPATSVNGDPSSQPDPLPANGPNPPHKPEHIPTQPEIPSPRGSRDMPFRSRPDSSSSSSPAPIQPQPTDPSPAVRARIIRGDVYYMPITVRFDSGVFNGSSVAINLPGRATATYPEPLTTDGRSGRG